MQPASTVMATAAQAVSFIIVALLQEPRPAPAEAPTRFCTAPCRRAAPGASGLLADVISLQPTPQSSQSGKGTANGYHEWLVRLSRSMAIFFLDSPVACTVASPTRFVGARGASAIAA